MGDARAGEPVSFETSAPFGTTPCYSAVGYIGDSENSLEVRTIGRNK